MCNSSYETGTEGTDISRVLRQLIGDTVSIRKRRGQLHQQIIDHISKPGNSVVLLYYYSLRRRPTGVSDVVGHYTFIPHDIEGNIKCVNDRKSETVTVVPEKKFKKRFRMSIAGVDTIPEIWFLRKR